MFFKCLLCNNCLNALRTLFSDPRHMWVNNFQMIVDWWIELTDTAFLIVGWRVDCWASRITKEGPSSGRVCSVPVSSPGGCETILYAELEGSHGYTGLRTEEVPVYWEWTAHLEVRRSTVWWSFCGECLGHLTGENLHLFLIYLLNRLFHL